MSKPFGQRNLGIWSKSHGPIHRPSLSQEGEHALEGPITPSTDSCFRHGGAGDFRRFLGMIFGAGPGWWWLDLLEHVDFVSLGNQKHLTDELIVFWRGCKHQPEYSMYIYTFFFLFLYMHIYIHIPIVILFNLDKIVQAFPLPII